ncbi:MAG TPA: M13 family metallopeptidase [Bryobacteraceae bacterium]|jgi:endothelin-converting enzyme/putative endopeptidase|nr:M13 family metallopeptidase [Bryobacteraceae bacterium]
MNTRTLLVCLLPAFAFAQMPRGPASSIDKAAMNVSVDPCSDFYQYACGNWNASHPLPADRSRYGRFNELQEHNEHILLDLLQSAEAKSNRTVVDQKIGDFYASCMDTATLAKKGIEPLQPELDRIAALKDMAGIAAEAAHLQLMGVPVLFQFGAQPDPKDSNRTIAGFRPGGLSLPDRDYYLKTDPKSVEIRQHYVQHLKNMFQLAGDKPAAAAIKATMVLDFETTLAKHALDRVSMRDPNKTYNMEPRSFLAEKWASFQWDGYFKALGSPAFDTLDVAYPAGLNNLDTDLGTQPVDTWKAYFTCHLLHASANMLAQPFENEDFDFWQRYLSGVKEPRPRNMRCVAATDRSMGDLLGQKYIEAVFGPDAKAQITALVEGLERSLGDDIQGLPWMTEATKEAAIVKLKAITNNVGYPKKWRDYSQVTVAPDDFVGNAERASEAMQQQRIARIGRPTDKSEWTMTPPTVNAFYSPQTNSINFPAGILQPPFFDPRRDMAVNYGGIGAVIGHEMTHGFDDQGRKFDADGNLRDWWTPQDGAEFEKRAACVADEYSGFTTVDDVKLNGRLTLGENTADNGGLRVAYMALEDALKLNPSEKTDGFTPEQRFFLGFAQVWCENTTPQEARNRAATDPHSPGRFRVNGTLQNMPEFQKAFACKAPAPMIKQGACHVW